MLYLDSHDREHRCTVITSEFGRLKGLRIVRGREDECEEHYRQLGKLPRSGVHFSSLHGLSNAMSPQDRVTCVSIGSARDQQTQFRNLTTLL